MSQGPVVRKLVNANLGLKFNPVSLILIEFAQQIPSDHLEATKVKMEANKIFTGIHMVLQCKEEFKVDAKPGLA